MLACVVPVAVLAFVAAIDLRSALVMLATLPLVPVFMWLIGRYTEERTRERWLALRLLSTHFLDVVRGLPTLRAFNRARGEAATLADVGERYRRATMGTLRVAFLSGSVLELAATLGVALVAVTVGVRLVGGGLGLQAGLTVLVLAPELYLPLRRLGAEYHASADGLAVADRILGLLEAPPAVRDEGTLAAPDPAVEVVRFERVSFALSGTLPARARRFRARAAAGRSRGARRRERRGEEHRRRPLAAAGRSAGREDHGRRRGSRRLSGGELARASRLGPAAAGDRSGNRRRQHPARRLLGLGRTRARGSAARRRGCLRATAAGRLPNGDRRRRPAALGRRAPPDRPGEGVSALGLSVVLDEPTADLDDESAEIVAEAIERHRPGRTVLVIAHRPELVRHADRVVRLEAGRAVELAQEVAA